ncbi:MAG: threonine/serine dehydratase [Pseudomonadota bacterium]
MDGAQSQFTLSLGDIEAARTRLSGVANRTPLIRHAALDEHARGTVLLKAENLQRMGSFKLRGAYNTLANMLPEQRERGVVAWSSGNHAQGVALAARLFSVPAHIVMPEDTPPGKATAVRRLGAQIVGYDRYSEDREAIARELAGSLGAPVVPSYDHPDVIAGQGTVGLEAAEQLQAEGLVPDQALICCGGGGLAAGSATALLAHYPELRCFAVEPERADDTARSFAAGSRVANAPETRSICDALLSREPGALTFPINRRLLSGVLTVSEDAVRFAVGFAYRVLRLVLEPGGAVALAAVLTDAVDTKDRVTVVVLSGGNIEDAMLAECVAHFDARVAS